MGKKSKKSKSKTDWDTFFDPGAAANGGGGGDGGGWHTGPASMALDGENASNPEPAGGSGGGDAAAAPPKELEMGEAAGKGKKRGPGALGSWGRFGGPAWAGCSGGKQQCYDSLRRAQLKVPTPTDRRAERQGPRQQRCNGHL
jgi:hypothetical protein